jgi:pimeloyl-ACP methyl ester carboxylesterase
LLSPFLSLKKIAEDIYGRCASCILTDTFDNAPIAQALTCPLLIIHGLKDTLVPYHHSISILGECKGFTRLKLAENMTHAKFNFKSDFLLPVKKFLTDFSIWKETE